MGWAVLVSSLQVLLKKTNDYVWIDECDKAFNGVKHAHALTHAPSEQALCGHLLCLRDWLGCCLAARWQTHSL